MRKLICEECGKNYDYDVDDFCPKCGAFNKPERATTQRAEGINESNHDDSFAHTELHEENRQRRGSDLTQTPRQIPQGKTAVIEKSQSASQRKETRVNEIQQAEGKSPNATLQLIKKIVMFITAGIVLMNVLRIVVLWSFF